MMKIDPDETLNAPPSVLRVLEIAAAGWLPVLLVGPRRTCAGASRWLTMILPRTGEADGIAERPWRAPHSSTSTAGLVGNVAEPSAPGEVNLAHGGVLHLDEVSRFRKPSLDAVAVAVTARESVIGWPAQALVVGASLPCWCDEGDPCSCSPERRERFQDRIEQSFPFVLRADLDGERPLMVAASSTRWRELVESGRRFAPADRPPLLRSIEREAMTPVLAIARTIADLDHSADVLDEHIEEARGLAITRGLP